MGDGLNSEHTRQSNAVPATSELGVSAVTTGNESTFVVPPLGVVEGVVDPTCREASAKADEEGESM